MKSGISRFLLRWFVSSLGLWVAAGLLSGGVTYDSRTSVLIVAGFILAAINSILKPIVIILSLPAIVVTLGLFMVFINGLMVLLVSKLYAPLEVSGFGAAVLAGMVIGLVNYLVTTILEEK